MTTQKRGARSVIASALVGFLIVAVVAGGLALINDPQVFANYLNASEAAEALETRTVTDSVGREVEVPANPQHIAALDAFSGNVCVLVGAGGQLMGAPGGVLSNILLQEVYPGLTDIEQLSGDSVNIETLLAAEVDVALVRRSLYEGGNEVAKLEKLGIPYVVVDYTTVEEQIEALALVGAVCGEASDETTASLTQYYRDTVALVEEKAKLVGEQEQVSVYHAINEALLTDGTDSLGADWISRVGAVNVSAASESTGTLGDYTATLEQVYVWAPNVIICNSMDAKKLVQSSEQWQGLEAVSSGRVYNLPVSAGRWGQRGDPETFLAMLWLGKTIYPSLYEDVDIKQTVVSYYQEIIGLTISDETYDAIISGEGLRVQGSSDGSSGI